MKHTRRILVALAALMTLGLALTGCTGTPSGSNAGNSAAPAASGAAASDPKAPITLTFYNADMTEDDPFTSPIAQKIQELTGITLKFDYPVGGSTERVPLMITSGDYPDMIYAKGDTVKLYDAGALVQLDDRINSDRGANIRKLYGDLITRLRMSEADPHYYALGAYGVGAQVWNVTSSMPIQNAVLKEFGYPKIKTVKDVEDLLVQYIEKYPEIDGRKTIGLSLNCDDWHWLIDLSNPSGFLAGYPDNGQWIVNNETSEAKYKLLSDDLKEFYRWLNHINAIGLLDPETFTQKDDDWKAKIANGQVLALVAPDWEYGEPLQTLRSEGKDERTYAHLPIVLNENVTPINSYDAGWSGSWGVGITTSCKNVERAFDFLDWCASDEAQILNNWGIEGEHYDVVDGKRVVKPDVQAAKNSDPDFQRKTGIGRYAYPFPQYGDGVEDPTGNTYTTTTVDSIIDNYSSASKETLAAYGATMWKDLYPASDTFERSPFGAAWQVSIPTDSDITVIQKQCDDYSQMTLPQIVLAKPEAFDAEWDKYIKHLKELDVDRMGELFTELVKAKVAFWK